MSNSTKIGLSWLPSLACMGLLFWSSSLPGDEVKIPAFWMSDKVMHFMAYAFLGWLISVRMLVRRILPGASLQNIFQSPGDLGTHSDRHGRMVGILYAVMDEIHQMFVPLRDASTLDWAADTLGVMTGSWLCHLLFRRLVQNYSPLTDSQK